MRPGALPPYPQPPPGQADTLPGDAEVGRVLQGLPQQRGGLYRRPLPHLPWVLVQHALQQRINTPRRRTGTPTPVALPQPDRQFQRLPLAKVRLPVAARTPTDTQALTHFRATLSLVPPPQGLGTAQDGCSTRVHSHCRNPGSLSLRKDPWPPHSSFAPSLWGDESLSSLQRLFRTYLGALSGRDKLSAGRPQIVGPWLGCACWARLYCVLLHPILLFPSLRLVMFNRAEQSV
jgi:hypothetical protein